MLSKLIFVVAIIILYTSSLPLFSSYISNAWESKSNTTDIQFQTRVAVVLGGIFTSTGREDQPYLLNDSSDRLFKAISMVKTGQINRLVFTGGGVPFNEERLPEAELMKKFVNRFDLLPDSVLWIESKSVNTYQNALFTKNLLRERLPGSPLHIYLVTSAMHMPRAAYIFKKVGFGINAVPTDFQTSDMNNHPLLFHIIPRAGALFTTSKMMREWMGVNYYKLKFWFDGT